MSNSFKVEYKTLFSFQILGLSIAYHYTKKNKVKCLVCRDEVFWYTIDLKRMERLLDLIESNRNKKNR